MNASQNQNYWSVSLGSILIVVSALALLFGVVATLQRVEGHAHDLALTTIGIVHIASPVIVFAVWVILHSHSPNDRRFVAASIATMLLVSFLVMPLVDTRRHPPAELWAAICVWLPQLIILIPLARMLSRPPPQEPK